MRILLAEDSIDQQLVIRSFMKPTSHEMEVVDNGTLAVELFKSRRFDLVLIHAKLPQLDGWSAVRAMRTWEREMGLAPIPIVSLARREPGDSERARAAGCSAHVGRPTDMKDLFDCLANLRWPDPLLVWTGTGGEDRGKRIVVKVDPDLKPLIPAFLAKRREDLLEIRAALKVEDYERMRLIGHRLKGKGAGYGFPGISKAGDQLEHAARAHNLFGIREALEDLASYLDRLVLED